MRAVASLLAVNLADVTGTGAGGRITIDNVRQAAKARGAEAVRASAAYQAVPGWGQTSPSPAETVRASAAYQAVPGWQEPSAGRS